MFSNTKHTWTFRGRFRQHALGLRVQPAFKRIKEAVSEIKKTARKDPVPGGEGSVLFSVVLSRVCSVWATFSDGFEFVIFQFTQGVFEHPFTEFSAL